MIQVKTIGVIGAGALGREIACTSLLAGFRTVLEDVSPEVLERGMAYIRKTLEERVASGKLAPERKERTLVNLSTARMVQDVCREADMLIEALPEDLELQLEIFTIFDKFAKPDAILASSTPSLSINDLAAITFRTENCVGMHFHSPVPDARQIEIVRATETSDSTVATCTEIAHRLGKEVVVLRDSQEIIPDHITSLQE